MGLDDDYISTLRTGAVSRFIPCSIGVTMRIPTNICCNDIQSLFSDVSMSGRSIRTMETLDSRFSQIKTTIAQMEKHTSASMKKSMDNLLTKFIQGTGARENNNAEPTGGGGSTT